MGDRKADRPIAIKVIPRILGGLGNQLFCYAAARRLAIVNDAELAIDNVSGFKYDVNYQRHYQLNHFRIPCRLATSTERMEPFSRLRRQLKRAISNRLAFSKRDYIQQESFDFDARILEISPRRNVYLEGYWQSERYFKDVEHIIRDDLIIIPPLDEANHKVAKCIQESRAVAVHVRFFDAPREEGLNNAPDDYYNRAIAKMETVVPNAHYFVFSDQPKAARLRIPLSDERITLVAHNQGDTLAYADLWLMTQCQHFIIANSTFSWWGAWLSQNKEKIIVAPGFEMRKGKMWWGFKGLLPGEWIKL
jgi:hypothetical protein